jgi:hypothetical protein
MVYALGGMGPDTAPQAQVRVYEPRRDCWLSLPSMPTPCYGASTFLHGNKIYVLGKGWGMWEEGSEPRSLHPRRLAGVGIRLNLRHQDFSFVGIIHTYSEALTCGGPAKIRKSNPVLKGLWGGRSKSRCAQSWAWEAGVDSSAIW